MHSCVFGHLLFSVLLAAGIVRVQAATYTQSTQYIGQDFLSGDFTFFTDPDPTAGRVTYVDQATATSANLTFASDSKFVLRTDSTTTLTASDAGRKSVRLESVATYGNPSAMVLDISHMPEGCGTWPAFWTYGANWPDQGEIDILEGVNSQTTNQGTLHTGPSCTMPATRTETGTVLSNDCVAADNGNAGCGVQFAANSFGPTFNTNGGGWFAMERTTEFIKIWFWARSDTSVPVGVMNGNSDVITDNWGTPVAYFPNTSCDLSVFAAHKIVINCGDWAGAANIWGQTCAASTGVATCNDYVNANPTKLANAYFEINSVRVYQ